MSIKLSEKIRQLDEKKVPKRKDTMRILFSNEKMFDLDGIYNSQNGPLIGRKQIGKVEKNSKEHFHGMVNRMLRGRCAPCSV